MSVKQDSPTIIKDLMATSIRRMRWGGVGPKNRTKITVTYGGTMLIINFITFIFQGVYLAVNNYNDKRKFMYDMTMFVGYWQLIMKCYTLLYKHKAISKLININNTKFWMLDTNILTKDQKQNIQSIYDYAKVSVKIYTNTIIITFCGHCVKSYLGGKKNLILNTWLPKPLQDVVYTSPGHEIFISIQAIIMCIGEIAYVIECDCIFIIVIASVIAQIRILKFRLNLIGNKFNTEKNILNLIENIKQHNLIFEYLQTIEEIFSQTMLQVLGSNMMVAVLCLFACLTEDNISDMLVYIIFFPCIGMQLFVFCLVGQYIRDETSSVAEAAYQCNWEDVPNKNVRIMIKMIITRAQKQVNITMGGILVLCLETFTGISRTLLSFLTFMLNIQK